MTASLDILLREHGISWDSKIASVIPEFHHAQHPAEFSRMTIRDICSHRTRLLSLDEITQGLDGRILIKKKEVVKVCNAMPVKHDLHSAFLYNNGLFELAGHIVERLSGCPTWGDFQHDRIFKPLGMARTTAFREVHETDKNIATPYMILTDGVPSYIPPTELSANSMNGGSGGIRSSVNDLLKWCACLLAPSNGHSSAEDILQAASPVFNRSTIANSLCAEEGDYCLGWCYHRTPAKLGLISPNRTLLSPTLGLKSPALLAYSHQGDVPGYTCNIYILPASSSAIVVLSNGTGLGDATDWIAQDIVQTIAGLQPAVDFTQMALQGATKYRSHFTKDFQIPLEEHRVPGSPMPTLDDFVGKYVMDHLEVAYLDMSLDPDHSTRLRMVVNGQNDQSWGMWHYNFDVFCHLPMTYDDCLKRGLDRSTWSSFLIGLCGRSRRQAGHGR